MRWRTCARDDNKHTRCCYPQIGGTTKRFSRIRPKRSRRKRRSDSSTTPFAATFTATSSTNTSNECGVWWSKNMAMLYSGMLPCFFQGFSSFLSRITSNSRIKIYNTKCAITCHTHTPPRTDRVCLGCMMSSTKPRRAAGSGLANLASYSAVCNATSRHAHSSHSTSHSHGARYHAHRTQMHTITQRHKHRSPFQRCPCRRDTGSPQRPVRNTISITRATKTHNTKKHTNTARHNNKRTRTLAPITAICAVGHAKLQSPRKCFELITSYAPPYALRVITCRTQRTHRQLTQSDIRCTTHAQTNNA
jgi:hypothetical protein